MKNAVLRRGWGLALATLLGVAGGLWRQTPSASQQPARPPITLAPGFGSFEVDVYAPTVPRAGRLATDAEGTVYVLDVGQFTLQADGGIFKIDPKTRKAVEFGDANDVASFVITPQGKLFYASGNSMTPSTLFRLGKDGTGAAEFITGLAFLRMLPMMETAWSLVADKEGNLYAGFSALGMGGDPLSVDGQIFRISPDGSEVRGLATPYDVADMVMAQDGSLLIADNFDNVISRVVPDGNGKVERYAIINDLPVDVFVPKTLALNPQGFLFVATRENRIKAQVFVIPPTQPRQPRLFAELGQYMTPFIKHDEQGNLYCIDQRPSTDTATGAPTFTSTVYQVRLRARPGGVEGSKG